MSQITKGRVTYGRTIQPAQYESKKAEVEIEFVIGEGEEVGEWLDRAGQMAQDKAHELVGIRKQSRAEAPLPSATVKTADDQKAAYAAKVEPKPAEPEKPKRQGRPPNPDKAKAEPAPNISTDPEDRKDPADMSDVEDPVVKAKAAVEAAEKAVAEAAAKEAADLAEMMGDEPAEVVEEITDKQLVEAIGLKNKSLADKNNGIPQPGKIKEVIKKYAMHVHSVPQEKRKQFIAEIAAL